jgi:hypothetical protein
VRSLVVTDEELTLAYLVGRAWEQRAEPDFLERVAAIVDWHDRRHVRSFERRQRSRASVLQCLRETVPELRLEEPSPPDREWEGDEPDEWIGDELPPKEWMGDELPPRPTEVAA